MIRLYLFDLDSRRVRPNIIATTAFFSAKLQAGTEDDCIKVESLLIHVDGTKDLGICFKTAAVIAILTFVDALFMDT